MRYFAQSLNINGQQIQGPLDSQFQNIGSIVNVITRFMVPLAIIILLFSFIMAGYDYLTSQGSAEKIKSAQAKMVTGVVGFILLLFALLIVRIVAYIFGVGGSFIGL